MAMFPRQQIYTAAQHLLYVMAVEVGFLGATLVTVASRHGLIVMLEYPIGAPLSVGFLVAVSFIGAVRQHLLQRTVVLYALVAGASVATTAWFAGELFATASLVDSVGFSTRAIIGLCYWLVLPWLLGKAALTLLKLAAAPQS
jgi:hypothetical protein